MFFNRALFILLVSLSVVLGPQNVAAKDYPIGTVFNDIIQFDFPGTRVKVPLPLGDWKLLSISTFRTSGSNAEIRSHWLIRHNKTLVTGLMRIRVPVDSPTSHWIISRDCSEKMKRRAWYFHEDSYEKHEDCNVLYPTWGLRSTAKGWQKTFGYITRSGLTMPNGFVAGRFTRSDNEEYLRIGIWVPPEHYGFQRERKYLPSNSPWNINNIGAFPKKKAFMEKAKAWADTWRKLVDKGFRNELRKEDVRAHPKIDGSIN